jgi:predicted metal-binding membrane protein
MISPRASQRAFLGVSALLFLGSAALTIAWSTSMSAMGAMLMPGGWMMSMAWMRMPGQTWSSAAASFLGMWVVMMVAMMLPSLVPMLRHYREAIGATGDTRRLGRLTLVVGLAYFAVWAALGLAAYPIGVAVTTIEMQRPALSRVVPIAIGAVVLIAGVLQLSAWKAHQLACCREASHDHTLTADVGSTWRHGLHMGLQCGRCCANLMVILLVMGVMDLSAMAIVTVAISLERLAPAGERVARAIGVIVVMAGLVLIAQAAGLG